MDPRSASVLGVSVASDLYTLAQHEMSSAETTPHHAATPHVRLSFVVDFDYKMSDPRHLNRTSRSMHPSTGTTLTDICACCGEEVPYYKKHCRMGRFFGYPNVRYAESMRSDLAVRYEGAVLSARARGAEAEARLLESIVQGRLTVFVVHAHASVPPENEASVAL